MLCIFEPRKKKSPPWTAEEIERMQELWGVKTIPQIAKILGRSEYAVQAKSNRVGLGAFKDSSEYMPSLQVAKTLGVDVHAVTHCWIPKCGLKCRMIAPRGGKKFTYIRISHLLDWLRDNQDKWDSRRVEIHAFGLEPDWLKEKRKADMEIPERKFQKWTPQEDAILIDMFKSGRYTYQEIGDRLGRSMASVEHRAHRLDIWGTGQYVGQRKQLERKERRERLERLTLLKQLHDLFLCRRNQLAFDDYWQKSMCAHWHDIKGCTAGETDCDSCTSFQRIREQHCARCGGSFFERRENRFCAGCRQARKKEAQRKWARKYAKAG